MGALGLEAVLVGDVVDPVEDAVGPGVREVALNCLGLQLGVPGILQEALLLGLNSVSGLVAVLEGPVGVDRAVQGDDGDRGIVGVLLGDSRHYHRCYKYLVHKRKYIHEFTERQ